MSWKRIVIAGLLCVVASPALAAPGLVVDLVRDGGGKPVLEPVTGDWQWRVSVDPDETIFGAEGGSAMAIEIGLSFTGAPLVGATVNVANFDKENFGESPFAFGENPADGVTIQGNQLFAALGSVFFNTGAVREVMTITTQGPAKFGDPPPSNLTTNVAWSGAYSGNARIAQQGLNFDTFSGSINKTVLPGDADFDGDTQFLDFSILQNNLVGTPKIWTQGDFDDNKDVDFLDFSVLQNALALTPIPPPGSGGGAGAAAAVPEPASLALVLVGACVLGGLRRRKNS
jgi:hypothetical protein